MFKKPTTQPTKTPITPMANLLYLLRSYKSALFLIQVQDAKPLRLKVLPRKDFSDLFDRLPFNKAIYKTLDMTHAERELLTAIINMKFGLLGVTIIDGQPAGFLMDSFQHYKLANLTEVQVKKS